MLLQSQQFKKDEAMYVLRQLINAHNPVIRLFKNNWTVARDPVLSDFTEANFTGYAELACASWPTSPTYTGGVATITHAARTWTATGSTTANDIYGYYLVSTLGTPFLMWAEKNPFGPVHIGTTGDPYVVVPVFNYADWDLLTPP